jgi:hypothetical protein
MSAATTAAVISRLRSTGLPVGDARKPAGGGWQDGPGASGFTAYLVVYPIDAQRLGSDASLGDRTDAPQWHYQVDAIGADRRGAETAQDVAARALLGAVALDGVRTVRITHTLGIGVSVDESVNPPLYRGVDRYRLDT